MKPTISCLSVFALLTILAFAGSGCGRDAAPAQPTVPGAVSGSGSTNKMSTAQSYEAQSYEAQKAKIIEERRAKGGFLPPPAPPEPNGPRPGE